MSYRSSRERMRPLGATLAVLVVSMLGLAASSSAATLHRAVVGRHYAKVLAACGAPARGHESCYALRRVEVDQDTPGAESYVVHASYATGPHGGYTPSDLWSAYQLGTAASLDAPGGPGSTQTVGIVDAFDDPTIEADLGTFSTQYGLPACTTGNGCFTKVGQTGGAVPSPAGTSGWDAETALDVEAVHAVCPDCKILLVEANSTASNDLGTAANYAALHANEVSSSYGGGEITSPATETQYTHPGVVMTAASGDFNYFNWDHPGTPKANVPAAYPEEIAVGGTSITLNADGTRSGERVWNDDTGPNAGHGASGGTGGGCSALFTAASWQSSATGFSAAGCAGKRLVSDVSAIGDPITGFDVYDGYNSGSGVPGWTTVGGTSLSSPVVAAMFALVGGAQCTTCNPARTLYAGLAAAPNSLYDVTTGGNGYCDGAATCASPPANSDCAGTTACNAAAGLDGPSGVGAPAGLAALSPVLAKFSMPTNGTHGSPVGVDASASSSSDGSAVNDYLWNWGDGSANTDTGSATTNHTFASSGVYTVSLTATSANGAKSVVATAKIAVDIHAPTTGGQPTISGTTADLNTLTDHNATWTDSPTSYSYQWRRCNSSGTGCSDIASATGQTHRVADADVGHTLVVVETATNAVGPGSGVTSASTAVIGPAASPNTAPFYSAASSPFATGSHPADVAINPASNLLAVANSTGNSVSEFSIGAGGALTAVAGSPFPTGGPNPTTLAYSPDGAWLAVGNTSSNGQPASTQSLTMFAVGAGGSLAQAPGSPHANTPTSGSPSGLAFSPDSKLLATADGSSTTHAVRVYSVASDGTVSQAGAPATAGTAVPETVAFSPSGSLLVSTLPQTNQIAEFAIGAGGTPSAVGSPVSSGGATPLAAAYSPGGGLLAVANANSTSFALSMFSVSDTGALSPEPNSPFSVVPVENPADLAWGPTGLLAVAGDDSTTSVFSVSGAGEPTRLTGSPVVFYQAGGDRRPAITFSGDGSIVAETDPGDPVSNPPAYDMVSLLQQSTGTKKLTVTVSGSGHVLSVPPDNSISCPPTCSADYPTGATAHIYQPASPQGFLGWSGDCSGLNGDCMLTMTSDRSVTASFTSGSGGGGTTTTTTTTTSTTKPPTSTPPGTGAKPAGTIAPPNTVIKSLKVSAKKHTAKLTLAGTGGVGKIAFLCKLDKGKLVPCRSPTTFKHLKRGKHTLTVIAVDALGHRDASPAKKGFRA